MNNFQFADFSKLHIINELTKVDTCIQVTKAVFINFHST